MPKIQKLAVDIPFAVNVKRNSAARRIRLNIHPSRRIQLILPKRAKLQSGINFLREKMDWITEVLASCPKPVRFKPGITVPLQGRDHLICHSREVSPRPVIRAGQLYVGGSWDLVHHSVITYMKQRARTTLCKYVDEYAEAIGKHVERITIRDMQSRWGSCSNKKRITLNWRLIMAPTYVARYVAAHEVAHMLEMNHSPKFWRVVDEIYGGDCTAAKEWLKANGQRLMQAV